MATRRQRRDWRPRLNQAARKTITSHASDLAVFSWWFTITSTDVRAYRAQRPAVQSGLDPPPSAGDSPPSVELVVAKYARLADLADVTPHLLRHSLGRHMLDAGVHLVTASATRSAGHHP